MALDEDFELGDAVGSDPDYAGDHRDLREVYRRSRTPRQRMLRQAREGFERVPELAEELMLPQSPLDVAAMAVLGPYGKAATKAGIGALGLALEPSEAEAALGPGFSKRFFSPLVELVRNLNVNKPMPERAWRELLEPNPKTGKQARFRDARTGLEHPVTPDEWEFARGDEALRSLTRNGPELIRKEDLADLLEEGYPALETKELPVRQKTAKQQLMSRLEDLDDAYRRAYTGDGPRLTSTEAAERERLTRLVNSWSEDEVITVQSALPQYSGYRLKGPADEYQESLTKFERPGSKPAHFEIYDENSGTTWHPTRDQGIFSSRDDAEYALAQLDPEDRAGFVVRASDRAGPVSRSRPWEVFNVRTGQVVGSYATEIEASRATARNDALTYARVHDRWEGAEGPEAFIPHAGHFNSEPNLLAHSRADRRTTVDGLKARHVDELQSDWHQQARDQGGYYDKAAHEVVVAKANEAEAAYKQAAGARDRAAAEFERVAGSSDRVNNIFDGLTDYKSDAEREAHRAFDAAHVNMVAARRALNEAQQVARDIMSSSRPPAAPLRKNWHEVELKKQLAQAIEDGDELLTWTTGDQQIERYKSGLQAAVDELRWTRRPDGKYDITPIKNGRPVEVRTAELNGLTDRQLEDTIGTEMARKIRESKGHDPIETAAMRAELQELERKQMAQMSSADEMTQPERARLTALQRDLQRINSKEGDVTGTLSGDDLTVGGAGMRSFYDRQVVDTANKLAKQYGGEYTRVKVPGHSIIESPWLGDAPKILYRGFQRGDETPEGAAWKKFYEHTNGLANKAGDEDLYLYASDIRQSLDELDSAAYQESLGEFRRRLFDLQTILTAEARGSYDSLFAPGAHEVHAIKITPAMREKLQKTGGKFSLYADGGEVSPEEARRRDDRLNHDDTPVFPTGTHLRGDDDMERLPERWRSRMPVKRDRIKPRDLRTAGYELPWEERARLAGGGRAERELLGRLRRWLNELGGLPVKELPEESYSALRSKLASDEDLLYHGRTIDKRNMGEVDPERSLFLTAEPGVAEAYAWPDTNWNQGTGVSLVVPYRYRRSEVKRLRNLDDEYGVEGHHEYLNEVIDNLPKRQRRPLYRFEIEDQVPLSEGLLDSRSQKFIERTYQLKEPELRERLIDDEWPLVDHDQYFAPRAGSLRRWKRGGRT